MKICKVDYVNSALKINFRANSDEAEYVYVPLIWNTTTQKASNADTFEHSETSGQSGKKPGIIKKTVGTIGGISLIPAGVDAVSDGVKSVSGKIHDTTTKVKDDLKGTIEDINEIKDTINIHKKDKSDDKPNQISDNHPADDIIDENDDIDNDDDADDGEGFDDTDDGNDDIGDDIFESIGG